MRQQSAVLRSLNGLLCLYKPPEMPVSVLVKKFRQYLLFDLNALRPSVQPLTSSVQPQEPGSASSSSSLIVASAPDLLRDNPLLWGPRFCLSDLPIRPAVPLAPFSSGVQLVGLGPEGVRLAKDVESAQLVRVYRVKLRLGRSTLDGTEDSLTSVRTSWRHVTQTKLDRLCAAVQAQHQRLMFGAIPRNSQAAFELASRGLVRPPPPPEDREDPDAPPPPPPLLFALRCVEFSPPEAVLEAHCVNETCRFFVELCDSLGTRLRAATCCGGIRRIRHGRLVVGPDCLLVKEYRLDLVRRNLEHCRVAQPPHSLRFEPFRFSSPKEDLRAVLPEPRGLLESSSDGE